MATAATNAKPQARPRPPAPPDERFWQRYSPHHEFPLSSVSSFALHLLFIGILALGARLAYLWGMGSDPTVVPTEGVRLASGGGGGPKGGKVPGPGQNSNEPGERTDDKNPNDTNTEPVVKLDPTEIAVLPKAVREDSDVARRIAKGANVNFIKDLSSEAGKKLREGSREQSGSGEGGPGKDGGKDKGKDRGVGEGTGPGKSEALSVREKRMLRWVMNFNTRGGGANEYFHQLSGLGAIIAIPEGANDFRIVYYPPGAKKVKSVEELNRIYWKDYDRSSIAQMMASLGVKASPPYFVAFMPQELEERLYKMELDRVQSRGKTIDDVDETRFEVKRSGTRYTADLKSVTFK